ncbi:enoyl-CoA hydratase/isomerase family protein [Flavobacterium cellulosilyticum]|uniref:Enoyl-CoA hydratase n=1 Tax=Flavobacterium cellulosilyticum TaxID=2541731 RepID=A0A4R5CKI4_9FLAO|nr:enoyl-CoA hydratase-related protein [Flavobacterium cellulosilyticum]TDD99689.1 enoyl-CoA hydratase [Flavobacterium cellulosilyticum]
MALENIILDQENGIATIFINRPSKLNALNKATIQELNETLQQINANPEIKVIIITGNGEKAFVAGADIAEFAHFSELEGATLAAKGQEILFDFIENMKTPVIAAINGFALGGGLELAMACHIRIASDNAKMGLPETSLGLIPGYGGTQRLPQLVGKGRAMEMILTAGMIDAETAKMYGLVNHVVPQADLYDAYMMLATRIMKNSPAAISKAIESVNANFVTGVNGFKVEIKAFGECFATEDFKEGTTAFLEKRKAEFKGK